MRVILTGATGGLGQALARAFSNDNVRLLLVGRDLVELQKLRFALSHSVNAETCHVDLKSTDAMSRIVSKDWRHCDVLINNAAIQGPIGPFWQTSSEEWRNCIDLNLVTPIELCRAVVPGMLEAGKGKIINLSGGGAATPRPGFSAYAAAKAALVRFTETLAVELKGTGIDVNCVAPGAMPTKLLQSVLDAGEERVGSNEFKSALRANSTGQEAIEKAVALCRYLASSDSDGITGKLISAVWDPWAHLQLHADDLENSDIYTLRRIVPADRGKTWGGQ